MSKWWVLTVMLWLGGCAVRPSAPPPLQLLSMAGAPHETGVLKQKVTLQKTRAVHFISVLRFDRQGLQGVILLPTGQTVLNYRYAEQLQTTPAHPQLPVQDMLALLQFALWPATALQAYPEANAGWRLQLSETQRQLFWYEQPVLRVRYEHEQIDIDNYQKGYSLHVENLGS
ncbi:hypothetical protein WH50_12125 [Pokkaliibacter plantistimulans]|uniref:Outer-membrane lipoprotein LolB n=1 Tax=Pokkaliibacter plantistimulans TaxID=1635171 RepID=A0ABX5LWF1_9GAMM|nr:DUF3261 domain-containing protein [Pokkaliibacter plantistimulans]PXF30982.1 hypothetical protein WH50_12125 [Pokkaliibacter plantistimulans]